MNPLAIYPTQLQIINNSDLSKNRTLYADGDPSRKDGIITFTVLTPIFCLGGVITNTLTLIVLSRRELKGSIYVYLAVLAFVNLCSSVLLFINGLSCSGVFEKTPWPIYDVIIGLPMSIFFNNMMVIITIIVTFDRICFVSKPLRRKKPKFCRSYIARRIVFICTFFSILLSLPYYFLFSATADGIIPKPLYFSNLFNTYNWIRFLFFGILPSICLTFGNAYLIYCFYKIKKLYGNCMQLSQRIQCWTHLTKALIFAVLIFVLTQLPGIIVSRISASSFLETASDSNFLEIVREINVVVTAISLSSDFFLYYMCSPSFVNVLGKVCRREKTVQMNVFVIDFKNDMTKAIRNMITQQDSSRYHIYDEKKKINRDTLISVCSNRLEYSTY